MRNLYRITQREWRSYFGSPVAYLFMAAFLVVVLFAFFWVDTFFSHNVANVHSLFQRMPLLLVFLVAAITMRSWSEERRSGTLELLLTSPRSNAELVLGKFFGCLGLVAVAIALTLPIPITVSLIGPLDWGPVIGGYLASLLLASTYIALGLLVSQLTESQIVSLIGTLLIGLALYFLGAPQLTSLAGQSVADLLRGLSTSARFDSIARGVVDVRDLVYYLSLTLLFLALGMLLLERIRWSTHGNRKRHRRGYAAAVLVLANVVLLNVWLAPVHGLRADLTQGRIYSLSDTTVDYLHQLQQPLLIRGYFSKKTHPLLAPLVPQLKNLLREYGIRGGHHVKVEIVDPQNDPGMAERAASRYDIKPVPFRVQSKYEASVVNSYFDVLVKYGDQHKVLTFQDLIRIEHGNGGNISVVLADPEYKITSAVQKLVSAYRRGGNIFTSIKRPVTLKAFISAKSRLPDKLRKLRKDFTGIVAALKKQAGDKLQVDIRDPGDPTGPQAQKLAGQYGIQPLSTNLLGLNPFFFNLVLERGSQQVPVPLPDNLDKAGLKKNLEAGLTRFASGLLNTVAVYAPPGPPSYPGMPPRGGGSHFHLLEQALRNKAVVRRTDLKNGHLPAGTNLLMVLAPENLSDKQLFTIDQFLMRGGTVVIAASPFHVGIGPGGLSARPQKTGLAKWLSAKGIHIGKKLVLDPRNAQFPIPVVRHLGGVPVREFRQMNYPYFIDVRQDGMPAHSVITDGLGQLTMTWASPITLAKKLPGDLKARTLLRSSDGSWLSASTDILPAGDTPPWSAPPAHGASHILATVVSGRFTSWFKNRSNPFLAAAKAKKPDTGADTKDAKGKNDSDKDQAFKVGSIIDHSPGNARLVLISSPTFLDDTMMNLQGVASGQPYTQPIQLMRNLLDWALDDPALLSLRDQQRTSRILEPLDDGQRAFWEYLNYGLALAGLLIVFLIARGLRHRRTRRHLAALGTQAAEGGRS